jgi:hypothetical protein
MAYFDPLTLLPALAAVTTLGLERPKSGYFSH